MASVLKYNIGTDAVEWYRTSIDTGTYLTDPNDLNTPLPGYLINPDISALVGVLQKFWTVDAGVVREMTQQEKDVVLQAEADAAAVIEDQRIASLDDKIDVNFSSITLTKIDAKIDNIGSLSDAKSFLKKLCRYIIKFTA
jgi:hypothetical protein